ncbi:unnamed protein product, partial [Ectocarpus fasciculatus]
TAAAAAAAAAAAPAPAPPARPARPATPATPKAVVPSTPKTGTSRTGPARGVSLCDADPEVKALRAEVRKAHNRTRPGLCPPGCCHQCKRKSKWTAPCSTCPEVTCGYCISLHRESPLAVLAYITAEDDARKSGKPPPRNSFTCYKCRKTCFCKDCGGHGVRAASQAVGNGAAAETGAVSPAPKPKPAPAGGASAPAAAATDGSQAVRTEPPHTPAPVKSAPVPLAPRPADDRVKAPPTPTPTPTPLVAPRSGARPSPAKRAAPAPVGSAPAPGSEKRQRINPPAISNGDGRGQPQTQQQPQPQHRQQQQQQQHHPRFFFFFLFRHVARHAAVGCSGRHKLSRVGVVSRGGRRVPVGRPIGGGNSGAPGERYG